MNRDLQSLKQHRLALVVAATLAAWPAWSETGSVSDFERAQLDALEQNPDLPYAPQRVLVKFKPSATRQTSDQALAAVQGQEVGRFDLVPGLVQAQTRMPVAQAVAALARNPHVQYAEPDYVLRPARVPNDAEFARQWAMSNSGQSVNGVAGVPGADIRMTGAWDTSTGGNGCLVAVIDSGVQWSHPDLDANIWSNPGEVAGNRKDDDRNGLVDDVRGWDFYAGDNDPSDETGHGTHVAGIIAAEGDNGAGVAGVAWNCKLMPLRFSGPNGGYASVAIKALNYAVAKGAKVSNNSWGGNSYSSSLYDAVASARAQGHIFVAAAGNNGADSDGVPYYPAAFGLDNVIAVASTDSADLRASSSNYGATSVDLGAPGVNILSTLPGSGYGFMSGTSMATPHVAGVVALVAWRNPGLSYDQVIGQVLGAVRPVSALQGVTRTGGVLDAQAALDTANVNNSPVVTIASPSQGALIQAGSLVTLSASASDVEDGDLSAGLAWSSSRDGVLGAGASLAVSLSPGSHVLTASVQDGAGLSGNRSVNVSVGSLPAAPGALSVTNNRNNTAGLTWADNSGNEDNFVVSREKQNKNGTWASPTLILVGANLTAMTDSAGAGTFRYRVLARNAFGDSAWTPALQVTVTSR